MEETNNKWLTYHETTKGRPPAQSLLSAVELVVERNSALDLGAGALTDTKYLLHSNFKEVTAVDSEPSMQFRANELNEERLTTFISRFEDFNFVPNTYDLINAQFALPFTHPASFDEVFKKLKSALKKNGIFVGQLFGDRDEWSHDPKMSFHTIEQVKALLAGLEVLSIDEKEKDGSTAAGILKHWHVFHIMARK